VVFVRIALAASIAATLLLAGSQATANHASVSGTVTDAATGQPIADVCIRIGPVACNSFSPRTDANGFYFWDAAKWGVDDSGSVQYELFFEKAGYPVTSSGKFTITGPVTKNMALGQGSFPAPPACAAQESGTPTTTNYLPNITKKLGGEAGWTTPFITQSTGTAATKLEISWYKFSDGSCVKRQVIPSLQPGTSFAYVPNNDPALPSGQYSVVVRSFGATIVSVVNQHQGVGARAEALSYAGFSSGATSVSLPNIVRRFFGYVTPAIIQNLGSAQTVASAKFVPFDGSHAAVTITRTIDAGRSKFFDPNSNDFALGVPGIFDGKQYSVTVTASQPIAVVVNTHNDAPDSTFPVGYSANGVTSGAGSAYGAYAAKNANNAGRAGTFTTLVVQNVGTTPITPSLVFTPLGGGATQTFSAPAAIGAGAAWAFDPRYQGGAAVPDHSKLCGSSASALCLGDGEYSVVANAGSGSVAMAVNVISQASAMGYSASSSAAATVFLPNVTRTLCACPSRGREIGWSTPILLQSVTATGATLEWRRFADGQLVHTQSVTLTPGAAIRIDPRDVGALADDTQYAVKVKATGGTVSAIVIQLAPEGDNAMIYEGFAAQ
jgi:hypothetical protein